MKIRQGVESEAGQGAGQGMGVGQEGQPGGDTVSP
jgi:hypothetical protein